MRYRVLDAFDHIFIGTTTIGAQHANTQHISIGRHPQHGVGAQVGITIPDNASNVGAMTIGIAAREGAALAIAIALHHINTRYLTLTGIDKIDLAAKVRRDLCPQLIGNLWVKGNATIHNGNGHAGTRDTRLAIPGRVMHQISADIHTDRAEQIPDCGVRCRFHIGRPCRTYTMIDRNSHQARMGAQGS